MTDTPHYRVVILGAGLCGLSAASYLEEIGRTDYLILERGARAGGLARTTVVDGFAFDHAIHILYSHHPYATDLICNTLLNGNLQSQTRRSFCYSAGVHTPYPYQLNNCGLPFGVVLENLRGLIAARMSRRREPPPNFESWILRTFGRGIAAHFMIPYNRRQWAWDPQEMSCEWITDRVPQPRVRDFLRGAFSPQNSCGPNRVFWYPLEGGIEALPRAMIARLPPDRLRLNATVADVDGRRQAVGLADGSRIGYDHLITTVPLPSLIRMLGCEVPSGIRELAANLHHNTVHTINIGLHGALPDPWDRMHWVYLPEAGTVFHRVSFPSNFSGAMTPPGCSSIQVEVSESARRPCDRSALLRLSLDGLVKLDILSEQESRPVAEGGRVRVAGVVTLDPAYIIYDLQHRRTTRVLLDYLAGMRIQSSGRFGAWEYLNMDQVILSGRAAAAAACP
ncbi:MAG: FAD-dependent oxidoreductase [Acidobacteria bacterium]|nr:FAD-dependent oxidoreductase [Acidobacteriota bacterium]